MILAIYELVKDIVKEQKISQILPDIQLILCPWKPSWETERERSLIESVVVPSVGKKSQKFSTSIPIRSDAAEDREGERLVDSVIERRFTEKEFGF